MLATYVDCVNVFWRECYFAPEHPATRAEDRERRLALLRYLQGLGLILGGEHVQSLGSPRRWTTATAWAPPWHRGS